MRKGSWALIVAISAFSAIASASLGKILPLIPDMIRLFGIGPVEASWLISIIPAAAVLVAPLAGWFGDRFGDRRLMGSGLLTMLAGNLVDIASHSFAVLMIGRAIEGAGFIMMVTSSAALMIRSNQGPRLGVAMALFTAAIPAGIGIGEALAGLVAGGDWKRAFWGHAVVLVLALFALGVLPAWRRPARAGHGGGNPFAIYRQAKAVRLALCMLIVTLAQFGVSALFPTYLHDVYGVSLPLAALMGAVGLIASLVGNGLVAAMLARHTPVKMLATGALAVVAVFGLLVFVVPLGAPMAIAASIVFTIGGGFTNGLFMAVLPLVAPDPDLRSRASGLINQLNTSGLLLGPPIVFAVFASFGSPGMIVLVLACVAAVFAIMPLSAGHVPSPLPHAS